MKCCSCKIGRIVEISDSPDNQYKFITIAMNPRDVYTYTRLVYSDTTLISDGECNEIRVEDLKIGDLVVAYHSNAMTMSIPPQTSAYIREVR